ncbi:MAG: pantothenate kinase [Cyanobacteria bacterium P01_C01_bin.118]
MTDWLALVIGNTRWHWAWFDNQALKHVWHTAHISPQTPSDVNIRSLFDEQAPPQLLTVSLEALEIWTVSVVPTQTRHLELLTQVRWINHFPLNGVYPTMGLDRMASLWGAGYTYGWPVLVIDAGTAITLTAGESETFLGGAILLGLQSHFTALNQYTASLPSVNFPPDLPSLWAHDTVNAIQSGVLNTLLAGVHHFIQSCLKQYPTTTILFTGGDGHYLHQLYQQSYQTQQNQALQSRTWFDENLMFWGIVAYRNDATRAL